MKQRGLITLGDVPELAANDRSVTITVARLDDNLRDPRWGKFGITQREVDSWKRNLDDVFGGRIAMDADHSADRGRGTRAVGWITGLSQRGKFVDAQVEFTPWGAKLVRNKEYAFTSPTFVSNYKDEHGVSHGPAMLGCAVTNRPVLRKGMPCLSLSRAADKQLAKATKKARKKQLARKTKKARRLDRKATKKLRRQIRALSQPNPGLPTAATFLPTSTARAGGAYRAPPGLDRDGQVLHARIARRATTSGTHYFDAMAKVTGNPSYAQLSDIPPASLDAPGLMTSVDPERAQLYAQARALAIGVGVGWNDAVEILQQQGELRDLEADDGSAPADWLDSSERPTPPRPWSDEDWARDKRRAAAAGVEISQAAWKAGAELGVDAVGQLADAQRADRVAAQGTLGRRPPERPAARGRTPGVGDQRRAHLTRSSAHPGRRTRSGRAGLAPELQQLSPAPAAPAGVPLSIMRRCSAPTLARCIPLLAAVIAAILVCPVAIAHTHHRSRCVPRGSETIAADRSVRVYRTPEYVEGVRQPDKGIYACLFRTGTSLALEPAHPGFPRHSLGPFALAGTVLAFVDSQHGVDTGCRGINVIDMAKSRTILSVPDVGCFSANFGGLGVLAVDLIVNEHGSVAWISSRREEMKEPMTFNVHSARTSGSVLLLDAGANITPGSLRLAPGGEVSWVDGSRARYASLA
jgi:hypothetical protein